MSSKPFCKVCYDSGKSSAEYSTHYVRNRPGGDVVCPTILNQQCKYCKKIGHTPSKCPALEGKYNKAQAQQLKAQQNYVQKLQAQQKKEALQERAARLCESPPPREHNKKEVLQARAARLCESPPPQEHKHQQAKQQKKEVLQARAARLCVSPPPNISEANISEALNENFPVMGETEGGKIIRPVPMKLNVWASIVARPPPVQAQAEQPEQAQEQQAEQPEQAQEPEEEAQVQPEQQEAEQWMPSKISWADVE